MKSRAKVISLDKRLGSKDPVFEVSALCRNFPVASSSLAVLDQVTFRVAKGEFVCILGRSGCGKSTLLKILAGFIPPTSGRVLLKGQVVAGPSPDRCVVFQEDALFPWLTVEENVAFGLRGKGPDRKTIRKEVARYLSLVGLSDFGSYLPREISGGMKQRVALARVLILKPQVLLMDEPFASLDAQTREEMQSLLLTLWRQLSHTILFVTHDVDEVVTLADRVLIMTRAPGRIHRDMELSLPRPRARDSERFVACARQLTEALREGS